MTLIATNNLTAHRLANWAPAEDDLASYTGRYFSDEIETFYTVAMGEDGLLVRHRRFDDIALTPKVEDSFNATFPVAEVEFIRDDNGDVTGMLVSNFRTRDVRFDKRP
jgi:hypothetical protein